MQLAASLVEKAEDDGEGGSEGRGKGAREHHNIIWVHVEDCSAVIGCHTLDYRLSRHNIQKRGTEAAGGEQGP